MGGEQGTHIGDCSLIQLDQDRDGLLKKLIYMKYSSTFSIKQSFLVLFTSSRFLTPRVRDVGSTQPCVLSTQGLTSHLLRAWPVTMRAIAAPAVSSKFNVMSQPKRALVRDYHCDRPSHHFILGSIANWPSSKCLEENQNTTLKNYDCTFIGLKEMVPKSLASVSLTSIRRRAWKSVHGRISHDPD